MATKQVSKRAVSKTARKKAVKRKAVQFTVTGPPFVSHRDQRWYIITKRGPVFDHIRLVDPENAVRVLCHEYGCTPAVAKRRIAAACEAAA